MAKSLLFSLALAAGQLAACQAALHPHGGAEDAAHAIHQPTAGHYGVAFPSHYMAQPTAYGSAANTDPSHYTFSPSPMAANANVATSSVNASTSVGAALITEIVTSFTTYCPRATAITVNNVTYSANASAVLTVSHCSGGCRVTRAVSEVSSATVTAIVSHYTTSIAGPTTLSLQGTIHTISKATVLTVSRCSGGCTVTTELQALVSSAYSSQSSPNILAGSGMPFDGTASTSLTASLGFGGAAATTGFAAGPTDYHRNSTAPVPQTQIGTASGKGFSFGTVVLACLVMLF